MFETLGIILIVCGAGGLAALGLYALVPGLIPSRGWGRSARIRIEEKRLLSVADLTPQLGAAAVATRSHSGRLNPRLADDLFAELFALRTDVAEMTRELQSIREQLERDTPSEEDVSGSALSAA